jgi:hypothetical protein
MATWHTRAGEHVWELPSVLASGWVKGEVKGRSAATRRVDARACPCRVRAHAGVPGRHWEHPGQGFAALSLVDGLYQQGQWSEVNLFDMVM